MAKIPVLKAELPKDATSKQKHQAIKKAMLKCQGKIAKIIEREGAAFYGSRPALKKAMLEGDDAYLLQNLKNIEGTIPTTLENLDKECDDLYKLVGALMILGANQCSTAKQGKEIESEVHGMVMILNGALNERYKLNSLLKANSLMFDGLELAKAMDIPFEEGDLIKKWDIENFTLKDKKDLN